MYSIGAQTSGIVCLTTTNVNSMYNSNQDHVSFTKTTLPLFAWTNWMTMVGILIINIIKW